MNFRYRAYGLTMDSDTEINEFAPSLQDGVPDALIVHGHVPETLGPDAKRDSHWQARETHFLLNVPDVARFLISDGRQISVHRYPGATDNSVRSYLVGSAMAALLQQRDHLTLHASCIKTDRGGVIFLGKSGMGKSTTCGAMTRRGYALIADDITAISENAGRAMEITPAPPVTRLWADAAAALERDTCGARVALEGKKKYDLKAVRYHQEGVSPASIFVLTGETTQKPQVLPLSSAEAFNLLRDLTFRKRYLALMGKHAFHFQAIKRICQEVRVVKLTRGTGPLDPDALADVIEASM